jgi:hypothetical protein
MATLTDEKTKVIKKGVPYNKHNAISSLQTKLFHKIKKTNIMSNFSILRPVNQQFIQYPYWIAQDNQFSFEEKGLLTNLLSFKDSFHKSALSRFASNGKRSIERTL